MRKTSCSSVALCLVACWVCSTNAAQATHAAGAAGAAGAAHATEAATEDTADMTKMAVVGGGSYRPLFNEPPAPEKVQVKSFYLDKQLVSNADFNVFTLAYPQWSKSGVVSLFADSQYLRHFPLIDHVGSSAESTANNTSGESPGVAAKGAAETGVATAAMTSSPKVMPSQQPVTNVSWFAARAFCAAQGKRLPSVDEWEYAARASATEIDASNSPEQQARILAWYSQNSSHPLPAVSNTPTNVWGVQGMHGVVWEMVSDFNSVLVSGESRADTQIDRELFCGAGASSSSNPADYAAFMRYALRSSYEAQYTLESLGFRCARDLEINRDSSSQKEHKN